MTHEYMVLFLWALCSVGCASRPAFIPATDCAKLTLCGQCASRGGCGFCGGRCIALNQVACTPPESLCKTPDRCLPPVESTTVQPDAEPNKHRAVRSALSSAFPQANITPDVVDRVVRFLVYRDHGQGPRATSGPNQDGSGREVDPFARRVEAKQHPLYLGDAIHYRVKSMAPAAEPFQSEFMMTLPMVRVPLPQKLHDQNRKIETVIGEVDLSSDHLLGSIELIAEKYADAQYLGYVPARVDLVTPARFKGARFGAIAVYLGYRNQDDPAPSFYMLEAGTATGDAKMIYFSPNMSAIPSVTSYYLPTPFVSLRNTYSGGVTMQPAPNQDEPRRLVVRSYAEGAKDPYLTVTVDYKRVPWLELPAPAALIVDAGARVGLIAKAMGLQNALDLQNFLSKLGRNFHWMEYPRYQTPAASKP